MLLSRGNVTCQCRVYRSFDIDSDHYPVITTLKLKLKSTGPHQTARFIPALLALSKPTVRKRYAETVSHALSSTSTTTESHSVDRLWTCYKSALSAMVTAVIFSDVKVSVPTASGLQGQGVTARQGKHILKGCTP